MMYPWPCNLGSHAHANNTVLCKKKHLTVYTRPNIRAIFQFLRWLQITLYGEKNDMKNAGLTNHLHRCGLG